jgi:hypothetical protein
MAKQTEKLVGQILSILVKEEAGGHISVAQLFEFVQLF